MRPWVALLLAATACRSAATGPYSAPDAVSRETTQAEALNREAADLVHSDSERAEALLREALTADLFYGPAHNNLGVIYLERGELYEAANEFEWARKLMPDSADPWLNLALVLESAGRSDDAASAYGAILEAHPAHIAARQARARLAAQLGHYPVTFAEDLREVALRGESAAWRSWAQRRIQSSATSDRHEAPR